VDLNNRNKIGKNGFLVITNIAGLGKRATKPGLLFFT